MVCAANEVCGWPSPAVSPPNGRAGDSAATGLCSPHRHTEFTGRWVASCSHRLMQPWPPRAPHACARPSLPAVSSWRVRADAFRTSNWAWPRGYLHKGRPIVVVRAYRGIRTRIFPCWRRERRICINPVTASECVILSLSRPRLSCLTIHVESIAAHRTDTSTSRSI